MIWKVIILFHIGSGELLLCVRTC